MISAIIIVMVLMGLGLGLLMFTDNQQHASTYQQSRESAYSLAEAALNAQITALSLNPWPTTSAVQYPSSCNPTTTANPDCPDASAMNSTAYPAVGSGSCPAGTYSDAWGSSLSTQWTTYVRDDSNGASQLFSSATVKNNATYDSGGDGSMWVRAVGVANCRTVALITKVSSPLSPLPFPLNAITANGFQTGNNGNKVIVDTVGKYALPSSSQVNPSAQPGGISVRCKACTSYRTGQVVPDNSSSTPAAPATTLNADQLASLKAQAKAASTYYDNVCPTQAQLASVNGAPVYVDSSNGTSLACSYTGNGSINSPASPGYMVLARDTIHFGGSVTYYGVIYSANLQNSSGVMVTVDGNAEIQGAINVDGNGTISIGDSHTNLVYDPRAFGLMKSWAAAAPLSNTFRQLPQGQ